MRGSGYSTLLKAGWNRKRLGSANIGAALSSGLEADRAWTRFALSVYGLNQYKDPCTPEPTLGIECWGVSGRSLTSGTESQVQTVQPAHCRIVASVCNFDVVWSLTSKVSISATVERIGRA